MNSRKLIIDLLYEKFKYELDHIAINGDDDARTIHNYYYRTIYAFLIDYCDSLNIVKKTIEQLLRMYEVNNSSDLEALQDLLTEVEEL